MKPKYIYILDIKLTGAKMTERLTLKVNYVWLTSLMNRPYYHNPGPVSRLQDPLQHEPVVGVHVHREQVKVCLHSELSEQLDNVVWPEHHLLQVYTRVLVTSIQK